MPPSTEQVSRRAVLLAAAGTAGSALLAACGGSHPSATAGLGSGLAVDPHTKDPIVIPLFDVSGPYVVTGSEQRLVLGLQATDKSTATHVPATATLTIRHGTRVVGSPITVTAHSDGTPVAYYPLRTTFASAGSYTLELTVDGRQGSQAIDVVDPSATKMLQRGGHMRPVDTPTVADHRSVEPICTRLPICPLHDITLTQALASGRPSAFLVATPAFCQVGVCGPSLDLLLEAATTHPTIQFLHAEVYTDAAKVASYQGAALAPAVDAYDLTYEPALFLADRGGVLVDRLDNVFDRRDLASALAKIA